MARAAVRAMHEQVGVLRVDEDGLAVRGVLVRHLVLPGLLEETRSVLGFLAALSGDTYLNLMDQYRPDWRVARDRRYPELDRAVTAAEWRAALAAARRVGLWRLEVR